MSANTVRKAIADAVLMLQDHAKQRGVEATATAAWETVATLVPQSVPEHEADLYRETFRVAAVHSAALLAWARTR